MANRVMEQGYKVESAHIFITSALGQAVPSKPGQYVADYVDLGKIPFKIK
jgi:hypothetical protein